MLPGWIIFAAAFSYMMLLFAIATYGDRKSTHFAEHKRGRPIVYALSLAIYCTSWTYFGAVGQAASDGWEFLGIYTGPILLFTLGMPLVRKIIGLAKAERLTSVADFVAARYGKNSTIATIVAIIALVSAIPYIALQLKAVTASVALLGGENVSFAPDLSDQFFDVSIIMTLLMALFAIIFGTRHTDATEHQDGLILAISLESLVKLVALCAIGVYITFWLYSGPVDMWATVTQNQQVQTALAHDTSIARWIVLTFLSGCAIILLPRQFHVAVVENRSARELKAAGLLLPLYLIAINLFVVPIAFTGLSMPGAGTARDLYVLSIPIALDQQLLSLIVFIGGFSAATAMVIVSSVALAIMISNEFVMPLLLRLSISKSKQFEKNFSRIVLMVRRIAIITVLVLGYVYYTLANSESDLASIGLLAFSAIAQISPALLIGLIWNQANARGAIWGLLLGFTSWIYLLLIPSIGGPQNGYLAADFFATILPGVDVFSSPNPDLLVSSVLLSVLLNCLGVVLGSLTRQSTATELLQAAIFIPPKVGRKSSKTPPKSNPTVASLKGLIARYLGEEKLQAAIAAYESKNGRKLDDDHPADMQFIRFSEQTLGSTIGSSSARLVLSLTLQKAKQASSETSWLLDQASEALIHNQDMLQTALAQMEQGIAVFDNYEELLIWNRQFGQLLELPEEIIHIGLPLIAIIEFLSERGDLAVADHSGLIKAFLESDTTTTLTLKRSGKIIEIRTNTLHGKGIVATFTDISQRVENDNELKLAKETLEQRVNERTSELISVNNELANARAAAEEANLGKTRFFAAAGHDILQPLNAARLYASALVEQDITPETRRLANNIDSALESVETILGAVLDISRLDTGAMKPRLQPVVLNDLLQKIETDFVPSAAAKSLNLVVMPTKLLIMSDPNLLRRLLQNLVSNAIKYTSVGKVLVGARKRGNRVSIEVIDSGIGIPRDKHRLIFKEFSRLDEGARTASGLGLGLSIVDRLSKVLNHPVQLQSTHGKGTTFRVSVPIADAQEMDDVWRTSPSPNVISNQLSGLNILCVDNEPQIINGMRTLLGGWGCIVQPFNSSAQVQQNLSSKIPAPDIIIADYHLGDGNGIDTILAIRRHYMRGIPALLITADRSHEVRSTAERLKIAILHKPIKPAALRAAMNQIASGTKYPAEV